MRQDAEAHAEEDRRNRELLELRNRADTALYRAERAVILSKPNVPEDAISDVEKAAFQMRAMLTTNDAKAIRLALDALEVSLEILARFDGPSPEPPSGIFAKK